MVIVQISAYIKGILKHVFIYTLVIDFGVFLFMSMIKGDAREFVHAFPHSEMPMFEFLKQLWV